MNMKKDPQKIVEQINLLVSELAALAGVPNNKPATQVKRPSSKGEKDTSGATGGIRLLIDEGKLDSPKQLPEIIEFLKQEGRHYSSQTISMGLLNLVRERTLTRFRDKGEKSWKYAIRR
jgi:hypothetical protein